MFKTTVAPRFYETDAFGHINNTVVAGWFETAREPLFRLFCPDMDIRNMNLILARIEVDFVAQIYYGNEVTLLTGIEKIGNASFVVHHEAWQQQACVARGKAVQVYFNHASQKSEPLPAQLRRELEKLLMTP